MRPRKIPQRKCVVCEEMFPKKSLLRIVRSPEGDVKLDLSGKASGRGAYLCQKLSCFEQAKQKGSLERALKAKVDDAIYEQLELELTKRELPNHER